MRVFSLKIKSGVFREKRKTEMVLGLGFVVAGSVFYLSDLREFDYKNEIFSTLPIFLQLNFLPFGVILT